MLSFCLFVRLFREPSNKTNLYLSIRTISNIYNFKLYRIVYKLKTKYMSTIENYLGTILTFLDCLDIAAVVNLSFACLENLTCCAFNIFGFVMWDTICGARVFNRFLKQISLATFGGLQVLGCCS